MQLAIVQNPHTKNPKELWQTLDQSQRKVLDEKPDKEGLMRLKQQLAGASRGFVVK